MLCVGILIDGILASYKGTFSPFKKGKNEKERLVSLSVGKVKLGTYFLHCETIKKQRKSGTQQPS